MAESKLSKLPAVKVGDGTIYPSLDALIGVLGQHRHSNLLTRYLVGKDKRPIYGSSFHLAAQIDMKVLSNPEGDSEKEVWFARGYDLTDESKWRAFLRFWLQINGFGTDGAWDIDLDLNEYLQMWFWIKEFRLNWKRNNTFIHCWLDNVGRDKPKLSKVTPEALGTLDYIIAVLASDPDWNNEHIHHNLERIKEFRAAL